MHELASRMIKEFSILHHGLGSEPTSRMIERLSVLFNGLACELTSRMSRRISVMCTLGGFNSGDILIHMFVAATADES